MVIAATTLPIIDLGKARSRPSEGRLGQQVAEACHQVERIERPALDICRSDSFDLEEYLRLREEMKTKMRE